MLLTTLALYALRPSMQGESLASVVARLAPQGVPVVVVEDRFVSPIEASSWTNLAQRLRRIVAQDGKIVSLVPGDRTALPMPREAPRPLEGLGQPEAFLALVASLDRNQVAALTSRSGLSLNSLRSDDQRTLFRAVVAPGGVPTIQGPETGMHAIKGSNLYTNTPPDTSRDWRTARLLLGEGVHLGVPTQGEGFGEAIYLFDYTVFPPADDPSRVYGVEGAKVVPNLLRPGALPERASWKATRIELAGLKTVGDALDRVRSVAGREVRADLRLAMRGVAVSGGSVPAGDLLLTLAHGLRATYRAVGPALLLTDDEVGLGSRASAWGRFLATAEKGVEGIRSGYRREALRRLADARIGPIDDLALTPAQKAKLGFYDPKTHRGAGTLEAAGMTSAQRERLQTLLAKPPQNPNVVRRDDGSATVSVMLEAGVRYAGLDPLVGLPNLLSLLEPEAVVEPRVVPSLDATKGAIILPISLPELAEAMESAKKVGLTAVWLFVSPTEMGSARLNGAVAKAKELGMGVAVAVRAFDLEPGGEADYDLEGHPTDVRPPSVSALAARAAKLNETKTDVVLLDTAPYGYAEIERSGQPVNPLGYSPSARLAFLRAYGYDPIDLVAGGLPMRINGAFYATAFGYEAPAPSTASEALEKSRQSANLAALRAFRASFKGRLLVETRQPYDSVDALLEWPSGQPDFPTHGLNDAAPYFRVHVPSGLTVEETKAWAASSRKPLCLDLSEWKRGVPALIRGVYGLRKVP